MDSMAYIILYSLSQVGHTVSRTVRDSEATRATRARPGTGVPRAPYLVPSNLLGSPDESVASWLASVPNVHCRFFNSGRAALFGGLRSALGDETGTVLVPAYVCDEAVEPFRRFGLDVAYYRLRQGLDPDLDHIDELWTEDVQVVLSVDYFGFPCNQFEAITDRCRRRDALHIDDNAHSTLSASESRLLGTRGDFGITSLRKTLPTPDGGVLFEQSSVDSEAIPPTPESTKSFVTSGTPDAQSVSSRKTGVDSGVSVATESLSADDLSQLAKHIVRWGDSRVLKGSLQRAYRSQTETGDQEGAFEMSRPSALTGRVLARTDPTSVVSRRRENYRLFAEPFREAETTTVVSPSLDPGGAVCPQVLPVVAMNPDRLETTLASLSIASFRWPNLPRHIENTNAYEYATYLADHLVAIPIHQRIDPPTAQRLATRLREALL